MECIYRVEVTRREGEVALDFLLADVLALGIEGVNKVQSVDLYFMRGDLSEKQIKLLCDELLVDPVVQSASWTLEPSVVPVPAGALSVDVGLLPGVTDTVAQNLVQRAHILGVDTLEQASTGQRYLVFGSVSQDDVEVIARRLLYNDVIQYYEVGQLTPHVGVHLPEAEAIAESVSLDGLDDVALLALSRDRLLSLDLAEMKAVQAYFAQEGRAPTDVELESLAQTWSEHCVHKTFKGIVDYTVETPDGPRTERIDSLIKTYLQRATNEIDRPWVRSAFVDNAGIVDFGDDWELSFKAETHNHPSALEPFGGANTGVGGVIRDIMGVSARPIANTDVLCFGPLDLDMADLPGGVLHPRRIYAGVVGGVEDYGNKMGIPTVNGAVLFDPGYTANPLVYCGCLGIAPKGSHPTGARPGDLVVVLGGRTGRDGLHGATFSSIELTDQTGETSGGAVQIGNPITEKMMLDAILVARDEKLYSAITDCGAGGLSSAVSEMGENTGVDVQLDGVPLKYVGLQPWEIWLSEAQERMVLAVPRENEARLRAICDGYSVEMTVIGTFTDDQRLHLAYADTQVADLSMAFLHDGTPRRQLKATWSDQPSVAPELPPLDGAHLGQVLLDILAEPNVRSKEDVVRRYDHEVLGGTMVKPLAGVCDDGPSDGAVLRPLETVDSWTGVALGCGMNPSYGALDPYAMAISAIDEAVRNVVCVGADPEQIAILDNFCWGNPLLPDRMGALVRACQGCYDGAIQFQTPFVSGKDSLNNEYTDLATGQQVAIPHSLLISAMGIVPDVRSACTMDLKSPGNALYLVGETRDELGGSYLCRELGLEGGTPPGMAKHGAELAMAIHGIIAQGLAQACHDCSEGGLAVALADMAQAGRLGIEASLANIPGDDALDDATLLYSESNSRYLVEVTPEDARALASALGDLPHVRLGTVSDNARLCIAGASGSSLVDLSLDQITQAWRGHLDNDGEEA